MTEIRLNYDKVTNRTSTIHFYSAQTSHRITFSSVAVD